MDKSKMNSEDLKRLNALVRQKTKPELTKMCLEKSLPLKGTKHDLAVRLLGIHLRPRIAVQEQTRPSIVIRKNRFGRYVHAASDLVFDLETRRVIGREDKEGLLGPLQRADIQLCRQFKFRYVLPETLDLPKELMPAEDTDDALSDSDGESDEGFDTEE